MQKQGRNNNNNNNNNNNIRASWTKNEEFSKKFTFADFHNIFYGDILRGFMWKNFSRFTYTV